MYQSNFERKKDRQIERKKEKEGVNIIFIYLYIFPGNAHNQFNHLYALCLTFSVHVVRC